MKVKIIKYIDSMGRHSYSDEEIKNFLIDESTQWSEVNKQELSEMQKLVDSFNNDPYYYDDDGKSKVHYILYQEGNLQDLKKDAKDYIQQLKSEKKKLEIEYQEKEKKRKERAQKAAETRKRKQLEKLKKEFGEK